MNWFTRLFVRRPALATASGSPVRQPRSGSRSRLVAGSAILALAFGTVAAHESLRTTAYIPIKGDVPTICFGETRGVRMGDQKTVAECKSMLNARLIEFETEMRRCLRAPDSIPDKIYVALLSLSYNIGSRNFCGSTVARRANAGDLRGACEAFSMWNKAQGRVVKGLVNRRAEERAMCLSGL